MSWETLIKHNHNSKDNKDTAEIDKIFASVFEQPDGKKVLDYLDSIITDSTVAPTGDSNYLWHFEGQRYLIRQIKNRIKRGKNG
tara:strand:+ start:7679 stop:7930 length:252 start_codon:yes stop_codon:yes gene_type:complete